MKHGLYLIAFCTLTSALSAQVDIEFLGLDNMQLSALDINYGLVAVGTDRNGVYWQYEASATDTDWTHIGLDSAVLTVYPHKSGPIGWAITAGIEPLTGEPPFVFCSMNGADFDAHSVGIDPALTQRIPAIDGFPDPSICGETYAVGDRVLYRRNYGDTTWHQVFGATIEGHIQTVKVRQEYPGVVLLGGADGFAGRLVARSFDFGESWEDISAPGAVDGLDFTGATADTIFAITADVIYRTMDGGLSWIPVYDEDLQIQLTDIVFDAEHNTVYAAGGSVTGNEALLLMSHDLGAHWDLIPLDNKGTILGLEAGSDGWIYFITRNEGVFRFRDGTSGVEDINDVAETAIWLSQNYPNPFNGSTRFDYEIGAASNVTISVLNNAGAVVSTLLNTRQSAGRYSLTWDASRFADGIYLVVLSAMQQSVAKEVVLAGSSR